MDMGSLKNRDSIFLRFLVPYLLVFLIPFTSGIITYLQSIQIIKNDTVKENMAQLDQSRQILEDRLAEVEAMSRQIVANPKVQQFQFISEPFAGTTVNRVLDTENELRNHPPYSSFIFNYYIVFKNSNLVLNSQTAYQLPNFYNQYLDFANLPYNTWYDEFISKYHAQEYLPAEPVMVQGKPYSMVTYISSLGYPDSSRGVLFVLINNTEIQKLLGGLDITDGGWVYITDETGRIISYLNSESSNIPVTAVLNGQKGVVEQTIHSKHMVMTYLKSSYNGWTYVVAQPYSVVMQKVNLIKNTTLTIVLLSLLLGLMIAYFLANWNSKPLRGLFNWIAELYSNDKTANGDIYSLVKNTISNLTENNQRLQIEKKEQIPFLRTAFFHRLLKGDWISEKDIQLLSEHIGLRLDDKLYFVVIIHLLNLGSLEELDQKRVLVKEVMDALLYEDEYLCDLREEQIVLLVSRNLLPALERDDSVALEQVYQLLSHQYGIQPVIAIGETYNDLMSISRSYEQAKEALHHGFLTKRQGVIGYCELPKKRKGYFYPGDIELRLMNLAKSGNSEEINKLLQDLYTENFISRHLSYSMLRILLYEMWGSIVKLLDQAAFGDIDLEGKDDFIWYSLDSIEDADLFYQLIRDTYLRICEAVNADRKSHNTELAGRIENYIQSAYIQKSLSLTSVAEQFNLSEVYLSQFFKAQTGVNFSDYVEKVRMDHACSLLSSTDLSVNEIAERVGYNSANTFCRVFKRTYGISTTIYRRSSVTSEALS